MGFLNRWFQSSRPSVATPPDYGTTQKKLLAERKVCLLEVISDEVATRCIAQLLFLFRQDKTSPVELFINPPGGSVTASLAIMDTMSFISCPIRTIACEVAQGTAAVILARGKSGERYATRDAIIGFTPLSFPQGADSSVILQCSRMERKLVQAVVENTGQDEEVVRSWFSTSAIFEFEDARAIGLIDGLANAKAATAQ
jgi:ATP-dependent Clp protease, protease subunit